MIFYFDNLTKSLYTDRFIKFKIIINNCIRYRQWNNKLLHKHFQCVTFTFHQYWFTYIFLGGLMLTSHCRPGRIQHTLIATHLVRETMIHWTYVKSATKYVWCVWLYPTYLLCNTCQYVRGNFCILLLPLTVWGNILSFASRHWYSTNIYNAATVLCDLHSKNQLLRFGHSMVYIIC